MAENSDPSAKNAKASTKKTSSLTPEQALEILQQAAINCQHAGVFVSIMPFSDAGKPSVVIVLANCVLANGNILLAKGGENA